MKTWQYYKDITFNLIKIFDIKLATWRYKTGKFCSQQIISILQILADIIMLSLQSRIIDKKHIKKVLQLLLVIIILGPGGYRVMDGNLAVYVPGLHYS